MKRFNAIPTEGANEIVNLAMEARYDIIAESETRARHLILDMDDNPEDYELLEVSGVTNQRGEYFTESLTQMY